MITYVIIGVTVVVSYICFGNHELFRKLAFIPYCTVHNREWYRLITHGFVHADMTHLLVNMFTFWSFGTYMESAFGYYVSIGASGAVSAVLFTSIFLDPWGKILFFAVLPIPGIVFGVIYLAYCQYMARKAGDNVNHNAHFYGALYGLIYPAILEPSLVKGFYLSLLA